MDPCYLDWAATAPPYDDIAREAAELSLRLYANPSSAHKPGKNAKDELESARDRLARALGCKNEEVHFCSGGSEADSIILLSRLASQAKGNVVISAIEHSAVYEQASVFKRFGLAVRAVKPDGNGIVKVESVMQATDDDTSLVSIMHVNNETGAIQPIADIAKALKKRYKAKAPIFHTDAVQALGKIPCDLGKLGVDAASFSAHKLGGPRGIGALCLKKPVEALCRGGGQEGGIRAGTQNLAGAWAFSRAAERAVGAMASSFDRARLLEGRLIAGIGAIPGACILPLDRIAGSDDFSPYIVCASFPGLSGETLARILDDEGIAVSTGSACSHASKERRVLDAQGVARELSFSSIRISTGRDTPAAGIDRFLERAAAAYARYKL